MSHTPLTLKVLKQRGFSLIELLVVIAIIGVLAGIIFGALGGAKKTAQAAAGAQIMRNIGSAIMLYSQDNGGKLPVPMDHGQGAYFDRRDDRQLATVLAEYLEINDEGRDYLVEHLVPPAYPIENFGERAVIYVLHANIEMPGTGKGNLDPFMVNAPVTGAVRRMRDIPDPSNMPILSDADQQNREVERGGLKNRCPDEPIYGSFRNVLFFDGHVSSYSIDEDLP